MASFRSSRMGFHVISMVIMVVNMHVSYISYLPMLLNNICYFEQFSVHSNVKILLILSQFLDLFKIYSPFMVVQWRDCAHV